jgi:hypothetical protein
MTETEHRAEIAKGRRVSAKVAVALVAAATLGLWLVGGYLRAEALARDYVASLHGPGTTLSNVEVSARPALPISWSVTIAAEVHEGGSAAPTYRSHMVLLVEPITGTVVATAAN